MKKDVSAFFQNMVYKRSRAFKNLRKQQGKRIPTKKEAATLIIPKLDIFFLI